MSEEILDLDSLAPEPKKIKFEDNIIEALPPKMGELMALMKLGQKLQEATPETTDYEPLVAEMQTIIGRVIPELAGKSLSIGQLLAIQALISEMSTPKQTEALTKAGIDITSDEKKTT